MNNIEQRFLEHIHSIERIKIPRAHKVLCFLIAILIGASTLVLSTTPWIQTAYGSGVVNTLNPDDKIQGISALVSGQIMQWHVTEGQKITAGDPIVTIVDTDIELVSKLEAQYNATQQRHKANETAVTNAISNLNRQKSLVENGLVSTKEVELAQIKLQELRAKVASTAVDLNEISMKLARQSTQTKVAPKDGMIFRLAGGGSSTLVKAGDILAWFIPDDIERTVQVTVNGLDAPLIQAGRKVRLQFEGWPVFQFSGWPDSAVGTFAGEVLYVEPIANSTGQFHVWIVPDPNEPDWPSEQLVRVGSRVQAWILLEEVKLGYELWRQLNNFPPIQAINVSQENNDKA